ncbi:MAG: hypothetical protein SCM11_08730 [Bacillota bacterium]|nr:hypothetical protein [Bacillota bacterium]
MNIYTELGLKTIINASDTYTRIGGSRMSKNVLRAMCEASEYFVDIVELGKAVSSKIAEMTYNQSAFISSGASACVALAASSLMTEGDPDLVTMLPDTSKCVKKEIILFRSQTMLPNMPYWKLIELSGAKLVKIDSDMESLKKAISYRTAGIFYFLADPYEEGLPALTDIITEVHRHRLKIIIDAAAQLPPKSNMWHYTKELGADGIIFSGGKFLMGPQSTGLFLGDSEICNQCYVLSNPNVNIGRPYKVGKEEYIGIYTAVKDFIERDEKQTIAKQNDMLDVIMKELRDCGDIIVRKVQHGRLNQNEPMLIIEFTNGKTSSECAEYLLEQCDPAIDIGHYMKDRHKHEHRVFINSINLRKNELSYIVQSLKRFLD